MESSKLIAELRADHTDEGYMHELMREAAAALSLPTLPAASGWVSVKERLPELEQIVLVSIPSGYDGKPVYYWGARVDDSEGWLWGVQNSTSGIRPTETSDWNSIEADDDYQPTHWQPLPAPPESKGER